MGHFFNPPPGPIFGATAAQPYAPAKLPPSLETVPNPPFVNANKTPTTIWQNAAIGQPDPWAFAFERANGWQPYAGGKLPPSLLIVPNPPFVNANKNPSAVAQIVQAWQPDPWPYVFLDNTTGGQPYGPGTYFTPGAAVVVVTQTPYTIQWMANVIQSWFVPDPAPQLPRNLNPSQLIVPNPPFFQRAPQPPYPADYVAPQQQTFFPPQTTVVVTTQGPYNNVWLASIIQSWFVPDPPPQLPRNLNPSQLIVPNPPFPGQQWQTPVYPPNIVLISGVFGVPQGTTSVVTTQIPYANYWYSSVLQAWQTVDPLPTLPRNLTPSLLTVPNPPFAHYGRSAWVATLVVQAWQPPDPPPTLPRNLTPSQLTVPNPPFPGNQPQLPGILAQWQFPPPLPTPSTGAPQVFPGPAPPPPTAPTAQFTVSGPGVSVYLTEFLFDVVYTDAPITKRTV